MTADVQTVALAVSVSAAMGRGRWAWVGLPQLFGRHPAREYVYSEAELLRAFQAYGSVVAGMMLRRSSAHRFRLVAGSLITGQPLGEYQWVWAPDRAAYVPAAEPMILWPAPWELPDEVLRGAQLHFSQDPYLRAMTWADTAQQSV